MDYLLWNKEMDGMDETSKRILEPYQYLLQLPGKFLCTVFFLIIKIAFIATFVSGSTSQEVYLFFICGFKSN